MAHKHHVMDSFFLDDEPTDDGLRREVTRLVAVGAEAAIEEGKRTALWKKPVHFQIRAITTAARSGDIVIYDSRTGELVPASSPKPTRRRRAAANNVKATAPMSLQETAI